MKTKVTDAKIIKNNSIESPTGRLSAFENIFQEFEIKNTFTVQSTGQTDRGHHAHIFATQILFCLYGEIKLDLNDSQSEKTFLLLPNADGVVIPPGIWGKQQYMENSMLLTLSTWKYDNREYIRDFYQFELFKALK